MMVDQTTRFDAVFAGLTILDISGRAIERIPDGGGVEFIDEIRLNPAGTASGALMNAAKLGLNCSTSACVGDDEKGQFVADQYQRMQIDCSMIQRSKTVATSSTILPIRPNGERPALHCRGASDEWFVDDTQFDAVCDAKFLHHGGTGLLARMDQGQSARLLQYASSKGLTVTLDLIAPGEDTAGLLASLLPHVDFFMPSFEEAEVISGQSDPADAARFFKDMGAGACIFKWGERGSFLSMDDNELRIPAFKIEVSDTTGCGDSYCGGFIAGLSLGYDVEQACRLGTAVSALVATGLGSDAGVVNLERTLEFMNSATILDV